MLFVCGWCHVRVVCVSCVREDRTVMKEGSVWRDAAVFRTLKPRVSCQITFKRCQGNKASLISGVDRFVGDLNWAILVDCTDDPYIFSPIIGFMG